MEPSSPHLQLILQRCHLQYISSYVATVRCFTLHIFVDAGMMMKQSVLCLTEIDQHYLNFHLPAERDTVTLTFDTLFTYF